MPDPHPTTLRVLPPVPAGRAFAVEVTTGQTTVKIEADDEAAVARLLAMLVPPPVLEPLPAKPQERIAITVPDYIPRKAVVEVTINGQARTVAAAVARALATVARGSTSVSMRAETAGKFRQQVPELALKRDPARKVMGKRIPFLVAGRVGT